MEHDSNSQPESRLRTSPSSMYFDFLPAEVFPTIIKYVFSEKNSEEELGLEQDIGTPSRGRQRILNLSMLVSDDSPFCDVVSQLSLTHVKLSQVSDTSRLWMDNSSLGVGPDLFENEGLRLGIPERIFQLCGESVKYVSISIDSKDLLPKETKSNGVVQKFVTLVKLYCPNVQYISFDSFVFEEDPVPSEDSPSGLIQQFSSQLYSIEWELYAADKDRLRLPDISTCAQIRKLNFPASPQLISFLRTCGTSLESLTVLPGDIHGRAEMLSAIEQNGTKLSTIWLRDCLPTILIVGEERYKSFLCSFGSQLTCAAVKGLSNEKLAEVVRSCPNLLIDSHALDEGGIEEWERVSLLGPMIKSLSVAAEMYRDEKYEEVIAKCTKLETLIIEKDHGNEDHGIENSLDVTVILSLPTSSLTKLCYFDFIATQTNIYKLSSAVSNLERLFLDLVKPIDGEIDFKAISYTNPHLNSVCIHECIYSDEKRKKDQSMEVLQMLVRAFSKCRSIDFDLVDCDEGSVTRDELHDICGSLPCRGVDVRITVGQTCYRQRDRSWW